MIRPNHRHGSALALVLALAWAAPAAAGGPVTVRPQEGAYGSREGNAYLLLRKVGRFLQVRGFDQASAWTGMCALRAVNEWSCQLEVTAEDSVHPVASVMTIKDDALEETWRLPASDTDATTHWLRLVPPATGGADG
jgi:hypothetical protein